MPNPHDIFNRYARNLEVVKAHPRVHLEPDIPNIVTCPQCFRAIERADLGNEESPFSLEHVPPESLGGRVATFTCRDCNSWAGHALDSHLLHYLEFRDFLEGSPGSTVDATVTINEEARITAELVFTEEGILQILVSAERSNPEHLQRAKELMGAGPPTINLTTTGRRGRGARTRRPEAALLRIAYLYAFSVFGYGFLINFGSQAVRSQFKHPEQEILPSWGISLNQSLPDEMLGINVVKSPSELRSFMVVFDLQSGARRWRYSVLIPGPTLPPSKIYKYLADQDYRGSTIPMKLTPIPLDYDYLGDPEAAFACHELWQVFTG
ncbi:MAG: HNH endonuclease [Dehalococcoidia bacterium]